MTGNLKWIVLAGLLMLNTAAQAEAQTTAVQEIVDQTNHVAYYQGKNGRAQVLMTITDNQGRKRYRQFTILRWDAERDEAFGDQKYYVYFTRPPDVNKMVFMVWKKANGEDDRWLYLPALDLLKRISSQEKRTSFVGSDFYYEDVSGRSIDADTHELAETTENYYVLKNTPKDPAVVEFAYYKMWIHRASFIPVKIEYYDDRGNIYRVYQALKVETIQGYPTVTQSIMKDSRLGGETLLQYRDVHYDIGLPETIFTERYMRQPPMQYIKQVSGG